MYNNGFLAICSEAKGVYYDVLCYFICLLSFNCIKGLSRVLISLGLVEKEMNLNGNRKLLEPFPPGTFEEYDITDSGFAKFVRRQRYFSPGDRPTFNPFVRYEGNKIYIILLKPIIFI